MRFVAVLFALLLAVPAACAHAPRSRVLRLSSLKKDCALKLEWVAGTAEGVSLECRGAAFLVRVPSNLYGHVVIQTPADALEFVRLFTGPRTCRWFAMEGMVELLPGEVSEKSEFNVIASADFAKYKLPAAASNDISAATDDVRVFQIARTVLIEQRVFGIVEIVTSSGYYSVIQRTELLDDASKMGVFQ